MAEENTNNTDQTNNKSFGAKFLSKIAMIFAGLWIAVLTVLKGLNKINLSQNEIIMSGVAIAAIWTPTYFSIFLDKIKDIKFGN